MELILTLEGGSGATLERERRVRGGRFTLGRMPGNDWVLPDPERILSKHHCLIEQRGDAWCVTDTSSNGLFLGDAASPIGQGVTVPLRGGERLRLGDFVLSVTLVHDGGAPTASRPVNPFAPPEGTADDLFDSAWICGKPLEAPAHPVRVERGAVFTRSDHVPIDEVALDLPRRPSPFQVDPPKVPPAASPATSPLDFDWGDPGSAAPGRQVPQTPAPSPANHWPADSSVPAATSPPPAAAVPATRGEGRLLQAFLEGAGLTVADVGDADPEALLRALGGRYQQMAGGLIELLLMRGALKREAGLERTMIAAADNNPLKLTATPEEAVRWLVQSRGPGYLPPDQAIAATLADLKAFMPELVQAMQHALRNLLHRFDPATLEAALADASLLAILAAGGRKAKYWELFRERYGELAREAEREFLREVGADFGRGRRSVRGEQR